LFVICCCVLPPTSNPLHPTPPFVIPDEARSAEIGDLVVIVRFRRKQPMRQHHPPLFERLFPLIRNRQDSGPAPDPIRDLAGRAARSPGMAEYSNV
ncbi:hypothetical protein, partial [Oceanithermus desulfurans]